MDINAADEIYYIVGRPTNGRSYRRADLANLVAAGQIDPGTTMRQAGSLRLVTVSELIGAAVQTSIPVSAPMDRRQLQQQQYAGVVARLPAPPDVHWAFVALFIPPYLWLLLLAIWDWRTGGRWTLPITLAAGLCPFGACLLCNTSATTSAQPAGFGQFVGIMLACESILWLGIVLASLSLRRTLQSIYNVAGIAESVSVIGAVALGPFYIQSHVSNIAVIRRSLLHTSIFMRAGNHVI